MRSVAWKAWLTPAAIACTAFYLGWSVSPTRQCSEGPEGPPGCRSNNSAAVVAAEYANAAARQCVNECTNRPRPPDECLQRLIESDLFNLEEITAVGAVVCQPPNGHLARYLEADRARMRQLERRLFLRELRSYRLSGFVCDEASDKRLPEASSEVAFKCLPGDYRRRACMAGLANIPIGPCSEYRNDDQTAREALQENSTWYAEHYRPTWGFDVPQSATHGGRDDTVTSDKSHVAAHLYKPAVRIGAKGESTISVRQLPQSLFKAKLLYQNEQGRPLWTPQVLDHLLAELAQGHDISVPDYEGSQSSVQRALRVVTATAGHTPRHMLIFGSISPWVEAIVHHFGVTSTVTVDYQTPLSTDPRLVVRQISDVLHAVDRYPLIASFSSIEHDGQGRYGDPLDPDGDLAAMQEAWLKLEPNGTFLLNVPMNPDDMFHHVSQRNYGPARLPLLVRGWIYDGIVVGDKFFEATKPFSIEIASHGFPVLILRKPVTPPPMDGTKTWVDRVPYAIGPHGLQCQATGVCMRKSVHSFG